MVIVDMRTRAAPSTMTLIRRLLRKLIRMFDFFSFHPCPGSANTGLDLDLDLEAGLDFVHGLRELDRGASVAELATGSITACPWVSPRLGHGLRRLDSPIGIRTETCAGAEVCLQSPLICLMLTTF